MRTLAERLSLEDVSKRIRDAFHRANSAGEMTLDSLIERSGLGITRASMSRKMTGKLGLSPDDCEAMAKVFGMRVEVTPNGVRTRAA